MNLLADLFRQFASLGAARLRAVLVDLGLMLAIGVCLVVAAVYGLQALHALLLPMVGPLGAPALLAGLMVILALALALSLSMRRNRVVRVPPVAAPHPSPLAPPPAGITADAKPEPSTLDLAAPDLATSAAFLAGFLLARRLF